MNGTVIATDPSSYNQAFGTGIPNQTPNLQTVGSSPLRGMQEIALQNGQPGALHFGSNDIAAIGGFVGQPEQSTVLGHDGFNRSPFETRQESQPRPYMNGAGAPYPHPFSQSPSLSFAAAQDARSTHSFSSIPERRSPNSPQVHQVVQQQAYSIATGPSVMQSPWGTAEVPAPRRPGPFDPNYPTAQNVVATPVRTPSHPVYTSPPARTVIPSNQSPWFVASTGVVSEGWTNTPASLTVANLGQHNQQQELLQSQSVVVESPVSPKAPEPNLIISEGLTQEPSSIPVASAPVPAEEHAAAPVPPPAPAQEPARPPKTRRKSTTPHTPNHVPPTKAPTPSVPVAKSPSPTPPSSEAKPAWGIDEEHKAAPSPPVMGLREIQAAEAKKTEARKAAERERATRLAAAASSPSTEDVQSFTASWGLPTSQAGVGRSQTKDVMPTSPATSAHPSPQVWTNSQKPQVVKKSMKEIQEEEERRKKLTADKKETIAAAARRGYAETTNKVMLILLSR